MHKLIGEHDWKFHPEVNPPCKICTICGLQEAWMPTFFHTTTSGVGSVLTMSGLNAAISYLYDGSTIPTHWITSQAVYDAIDNRLTTTFNYVEEE